MPGVSSVLLRLSSAARSSKIAASWSGVRKQDVTKPETRENTAEHLQVVYDANEARQCLEYVRA